MKKSHLMQEARTNQTELPLVEAKRTLSFPAWDVCVCDANFDTSQRWRSFSSAGLGNILDKMCENLLLVL